LFRAPDGIAADICGDRQYYLSHTPSAPQLVELSTVEDDTAG
jgi:hypothetical protein